ncbi:hypothetical protein B0O99DRAFT_189445 [Bisporella sp. PMI_857]|nr:hypothetical protein B0O99DRAFT_189445 [Bisporella sp. PMI_857]
MFSIWAKQSRHFSGRIQPSLDRDITSPTQFDNLTFYDPVADKWFSQLASGEIPDQRVGACSVEVAGPIEYLKYLFIANRATQLALTFSATYKCCPCQVFNSSTPRCKELFDSSIPAL